MAKAAPRSRSSSRTTPTRRRATDPATRYAEAVISGRVVACRLVRLACERHMRDLVEGPKRGLRWNPESARYACDFFRHYLRHSKGEWGGQAFVLEPWQEFVLGSVWGWKRADGTRRFRVVWEELPRKNGKSQKLAGVGLLCLVADGEPGADVYAAATKKDQARIIFGEAQKMVRASADLRDMVKIFKVNLSIDETGSKFEPLSSDERTLDGLNPHCVLIDEIHKHKSRALLDVMDTALGARRQPLLWQITTAGDDNPETVYAQENDYAVKVLEGVREDDSFFAFIATLDDGDRWDDPKVWIKANPNLGVSVKLDDLKRQADKAKNSPSGQAAFKRLRMNVRTAAANKFIPAPLWAKNSRGPFDPAEMYRRRCYGAFDLSSKVDLSCFLMLFPPLTGGEKWRVVAKFWMPADTVTEKSDRDQVQYQRWIKEGWIEPTPGNVIDHNEIQACILEQARLQEITALAYDPWNAAQLAVALQNEGLPVYEFVQGIRSYTAPTKELEVMLLANKIDHGNNPVMTWMASNLAVITDKNENKMPTKKHSIGRIDGLTSLIMAIGMCLTKEALRSAYETHGPRVV